MFQGKYICIIVETSQFLHLRKKKLSASELSFVVLSIINFLKCKIEKILDTENVPSNLYMERLRKMKNGRKQDDEVRTTEGKQRGLKGENENE